MKDSDGVLNDFHENMEDILKNITPAQEIKQRVFARLKQSEDSFRWRKLKPVVATSLAGIVLAAVLIQMPPVYAQVMPIWSKAVTWIQEVAKIPVRLPGEWQPLKDDEDNRVSMPPVSKTEENTVNYSFFINNDSESYDIGIYSVESPVPVSQAVFMGQKSIPLGYREYGSIGGQKITGSTPGLKYNYDIPDNAEQFDLVSGVKGYKAGGGTQVWWKQGNWLLEFSGSTTSMKTLEELASAWRSMPQGVGEIGHVEIVEGNMYNIEASWDKADMRYNLFIRGGCDGKLLVDIISSLGSSDPKTPVAENLVSRIEQTTKIPVLVPQAWEPFAEYDKKAGAYVYDAGGEPSGSYDGKYYYFEAERSAGGYSINAYHAEYPVAFNDKEADLQKNGPKFAERFAGAFSAEKLQKGTAFPTWPIPDNGEQFTLIPGVTAVKSDSGSKIMWQQGNWTFDYQDNNSGHDKYTEQLDYLREFASAWKSDSFAGGSKGHISITNGSKLSVYVTWEEDDVFYSYSSSTPEVSDILKVLNSFKDSRISIP